MSHKPALTIKVTTNPTWSFETEGGKKKATFDKTNPKVIEGMFRETAQMLFHHLGASAAEQFAAEVIKGNADFYRTLKP
jgi:hypothetical protein